MNARGVWRFVRLRESSGKVSRMEGLEDFENGKAKDERARALCYARQRAHPEHKSCNRARGSTRRNSFGSCRVSA